MTDTERRLAAILAADVAGYSRLMGEDEEATLSTLRSYRERIWALIAKRGGQPFGSVGDSIMAEFASAVEAVRCAVDIQLALDQRNKALPEPRRMLFRIGIHMGDILVQGDYRVGECVNVAARLESLAMPGGVCLSAMVVGHVRHQLELDFEDLGAHRVKNIRNPVHVFRIPLGTELQDVSPYRGLGVFEFEDARFFHGRTKAIDIAQERLTRQAEAGVAFMLIYGMSGTGKSSLVRAGLLPAIVRASVLAEEPRPKHGIFRPSEGAYPCAALCLALQRADLDLPILDAEPSAADIEGFVNALIEALSIAAPSPVRLIIVVDQMEELFTAEGADAGAQKAFVDLLGRLARSGHAWVVCTIRTDFLHHCAAVPGFSTLKDGFGSYELLPPSAPEIAQIIRNPARSFGVRFEENDIEGRLEDVLQEAAAKDQGSLPLLEFMLDRLYERGKDQRLLTFADYHAVGGLEGAIAQRADDLLASLDPDIRAALPSVLGALITIRAHDKVVTARAAVLEDVLRGPSPRCLIEAFVAGRLFVSDHNERGDAVIRVAHEALLTRWPRAQAIIAADREFLEVRARVQDEARRWLDEDRNPDLLLPTGKRLAEAQDLLSSRLDVLDERLIDYVKRSSQAQKQREEAALAAKHQVLTLEAEAAREREEAARSREASAHRLASRNRLAAIIISILALLAAGAAGLAAWQAEKARGNAEQARVAEEEAERQALQAESGANRARAEAARAAEAEALARNEAARAADEAERARLAEERANLGDSLYRAVQARQLVRDDMPVTAMQVALAGLPRLPADPDRAWIAETAGALVEALGARREKRILRGHGGNVSSLDIDGDVIISGSWDNTVRLWDAAEDYRTKPLGAYRADVLTTVLSPDGRLIAIGGRNNAIDIQEIAGGQSKGTLLGHDRDVLSVTFSPDGTKLASGSRDKTVGLWDVETGRLIQRLRGHEGSVYAVAFSPDGRELVSGSRDGTIKRWAAASGALVGELGSSAIKDSGGFLALVYLEDGRQLMSGSADNTIRLWDIETGREIRKLVGHGGDVYALSVFADGSRIASASLDKTVRVWDIATGRELDILKGHTQAVYALDIADDDRTIVSGSRDNTIRLWDLGVSPFHNRWHGKAMVQALATFPGNDPRVAIGLADGLVQLWNASANKPPTTLQGHRGAILALDVSPDGEVIASASADNTIRLWRAETGAEMRVFKGHRGDVSAVSFSPNGQFIASGSGDNSIRLWDRRTGEQLQILRRHSGDVHAAGDVTSIAFTHDGTRIVSALRDNTLRIWDLGTGGYTVLKGHQADVLGVAVLPDNNRIVSVSEDTSIRIWDSLDGRLLNVLSGHEQPVTSVAVTKDGRRIATGSRDHTTRVWNAETGDQLQVLRRHGGPVLAVDWRGDDACLISGGADRMVEMSWVGRDPGDLIATAKANLPRPLTPAEKQKYHVEGEQDY